MKWNDENRILFSRSGKSYRRGFSTRDERVRILGKTLTNRFIASEQCFVTRCRKTFGRSTSRRRDQNSFHPRNENYSNGDKSLGHGLLARSENRASLKPLFTFCRYDRCADVRIRVH